MPFALLFAQVLGVAQLQEFVTAVLVTASLAPVQIYVTEVLAPVSVRHNSELAPMQYVEITIATFILTTWLTLRLNLALGPSFLIVIFGQCYVWLAYFSSRRILKFQTISIIGGRNSFFIGALVPLTFLIVTGTYFLIPSGTSIGPGILYLLIFLPTAIQYICVRSIWSKSADFFYQGTDIQNESSKRQPFVAYFAVAVLMAIVAQHWKIELANAVVGFAALSIYVISPFSSFWLIFSKSRYMTQDRSAPLPIVFWATPVLVGLTLLAGVLNPVYIFMLALVTQIMTFKFITDTRARISIVDETI